MLEEGYIKYQCNYSKKDVSELNIPVSIYDDLIYYRQELFNLGLIGAYVDGIGFGNISHRIYDSSFLISGTASGNIETLGYEHFCLVESWDIEKNYIQCEGMLKASSESLTHAAVYQTLSHINAVIHIHSEKLWRRYLSKYQTTPDYAEYGTPELAKEIMELLRDNPDEEIIILGGHKDGIIAIGGTTEKAFNNLLSLTD